MNTAEISGIVKDPAGEVIPNAAVVALNTATRLKFTAATNDAGEYLLTQLPVGSYSLTISARDFKQAISENIVLHLGDRIRQDFQLVVGEQSETMVVQEAPDLVQTESAAIKDVVENQQVLDLPLKDREFLQLSLMSAGVVSPPGGTRGDSLQQTGKLINILGQRTGHNLFLFDGVSVTDEYFNNVVLTPPPEAIQEFNISKTNYSAEFGGKSGGVVNVITQSGTNRFHGTLYEFLRNDLFDAKNFFSPMNQPTAPFQENQFGGTPFPGNTINIPLDPAASALLAKVPLPNLPGQSNNFLAVDKQTNGNNQFNGRLDHQFSTRDSAYLRASIFDANEVDPFGSSVLNEALLPGFGRTLTTHSVNLSLGETHVFSPRILNEFRFGWLGVSGGQGDPNAGNNFAGQYGIQGATTNRSDMGFLQVSLSNLFSTMGSATGFTTRTDRNFELYDNVSIQHGAHTIQFGAYFFHLSFNPSYPNDARGLYTFSGAYTGNAFADFLLGYSSQAQVGIGEGSENASTSWAHFYIQDGWR